MRDKSESSNAHSGKDGSGLSFPKPRLTTSSRGGKLPIQRRSHKKSRNGCFSCKARRIKCGEEKPECANCVGWSGNCTYPSSYTIQAQPMDTGLMQCFSMQDLQCFHHYLHAALPHLPLGSGRLWREDIPQLAFHRPYLMHALLGLGAFHLNAVCSEDRAFRQSALDHRIRALQSLKQAMSTTTAEASDGGAILAACYALAFQSIYLANGMNDYIVLVRGCYLTTNAFRHHGSITALPDQHLHLIAQELENMPKAKAQEIQDAIGSLQQIMPLLQSTPELEFYQGIEDVFAGLLECSRLGYERFISLYNAWTTQESFETLKDNDNLTMQLLLFFYVLESIIFAPLAPWDFPEDAPISEHRLKGMVEWSDSIWANLPEGLRWYLRWPKSVLDRVRLIKDERTGESPWKDAIRILFVDGEKC
ncbi:uncharacterized protein Z519_05148 [Cladophialophora bantiana CBS 173.52]|uniref:Zn(2)-C6 fungal-type domain-containing protein n=1 Tax=Cladophialophora bantiana (strain ATCC 10958 / CBS 173.52 / CDC B-1940 / NIH 8579) TaxID=1442370 RepID=A0A0D2HKL8_CLAB1|nr:uncharacterized protein Z519_05148 [Cladophialophora bantiana CBS 173.52]KIW93833.1 hypothetical protein Z519_05148 [Cladophialophora bantiana CBS 173.52]